MQLTYHFSVDDVLASLLQLSDWRLDVVGQPCLAFLDRLHREYGAMIDLYLFESAVAPDGRVRQLRDVDDRAIAALGAASGFRFGPHAIDYATAPHAQPAPDLIADMERLCATIARLTAPERRSRWVRLHYFSEVWEAAEVWRRHGIEALMTTDKPAIAYRLEPHYREALARAGRTSRAGVGFVRSHLRLESLRGDADDPARFASRIDEVLDCHGFVTLFTHEIDLDDPAVRRLAETALGHLQRRGASPI
jgi:hypothetical protein